MNTNPITNPMDVYKFLNGKRIESSGYSGILRIGFYAGAGHRIAVQAICNDGVPLATLTVNIPKVDLKPGEILVKIWSENEQFAVDMLKTGWFKDTGKRVPTGWVEAQIWEVVK